MTRTINGRQQYETTIRKGRRTLWVLDTWHTSEADAIDYARRMATYHHAEIPADQITVTAIVRGAA